MILQIIDTGKRELYIQLPFNVLSHISGRIPAHIVQVVDTQMYIDGYQVKPVSDASYGSLWEVSFTLKEF